MLKKTLSVNNDVDITYFSKLKSLIKTNAKGYKPRKAFVLKWEQILQFMNTAPDYDYLEKKVIITDTLLH